MTTVLSMIVALLGGWLVPWLAMKFIMARRFKSGKQQTTNYAGATVNYGLSLVWVVWAVVLAAVLFKATIIMRLLPSLDAAVLDLGFVQVIARVVQSYTIHNSFFLLAIPLVLSCFFFGWLDDRFGQRGSGGFKGHLKALLRGKFTTGTVKVLGIGFTALIIGYLANSFGLGFRSFAALSAFNILWILLSMCAIAFSANLINLFDLRPARASKVYSSAFIDTVFIVICIKLVVSATTGVWNPWQTVGTELVYLLWVLGPIFAIWSFDAGERAMLGDAGANPAGALLGLYAVMGLWILLPAYVLLVFVFNMLSERYSFSAIIEEIPVLKKLDMLGRPAK